MPRKRSPFKSCKTAADVAAALQGITSPTVSQIAQAKLIIKMLSLAPAASEPEENATSSDDVPIGDPKPQRIWEPYTEHQIFMSEAIPWVHNLQQQLKRTVTLEDCLAEHDRVSKIELKPWHSLDAAILPWREPAREKALTAVLVWEETHTTIRAAVQATPEVKA
jgi:hypothetical protein